MARLTEHASQIAGDLVLTPTEMAKFHAIASQGPAEVERAAAEALAAATERGGDKQSQLPGALASLAAIVEEERSAAGAALLERAKIEKWQRDEAERQAERDEVAADPVLASGLVAAEARMKATRDQNAVAARKAALQAEISRLKGREEIEPGLMGKRADLEVELAGLDPAPTASSRLTSEQIMRLALAEARAELAKEGE